MVEYVDYLTTEGLASSYGALVSVKKSLERPAVGGGQSIIQAALKGGAGPSPESIGMVLPYDAADREAVNTKYPKGYDDQDKDQIKSSQAHDIAEARIQNKKLLAVAKATLEEMKSEGKTPTEKELAEATLKNLEKMIKGQGKNDDEKNFNALMDKTIDKLKAKVKNLDSPEAAVGNAVKRLDTTLDAPTLKAMAEAVKGDKDLMTELKAVKGNESAVTVLEKISDLPGFDATAKKKLDAAIEVEKKVIADDKMASVTRNNGATLASLGVTSDSKEGTLPNDLKGALAQKSSDRSQGA
jgi:hypothetical protein